MTMQRNVIMLSLIAVLSAAVQPLARFIDGLLFSPILVLPAVGLSYSGWALSLYLLGRVLWRNRKHWRIMLMASAALIVAIASMLIQFAVNEPWSAFLLGMKTRISTKVGISAMRTFAQDIVHDPNGIVWDNSAYDPRSGLDGIRREKLSLQYPFLRWGFDYGKVLMYDNIVSMSWGGGLAGGWGFEVAVSGDVPDIKRDGIHGVSTLRVSDDIQFYWRE